MTTYFSGFAPNGAAVTLETACYDGHILPGKRGPAVASVFEIKNAVSGPREILQSKNDPDTYLLICAVGELSGKAWHTVVVAKKDGENRLFVATAYNAVSYASKGARIWPQ